MVSARKSSNDILTSQRVAYIGKTGSGKTYLAQHVLAPVRRLIVLDGKGTLGGRNWNLSPAWDGATIRQLRTGHPGRLRITGFDYQQHWKPALDLAWQIRNVVVYIDEMTLVAHTPSNPPIELRRLYQMGRELNIGVQASTQRPRGVPAIMFSEADWIFLFRVSKREDRKTVSDFGDEYGYMMRPISDVHGFWGFNTEWRVPQYSPEFNPRNGLQIREPQVKGIHHA